MMRRTLALALLTALEPRPKPSGPKRHYPPPVGAGIAPDAGAAAGAI